ncbi:beta-ketoacyl synthase [Microbulbifer sp. HZ11]|uniref:beta-ketoacyl-[acyl-carrier-protein] synthase family protein n=1 Tax=unclassified Microbulbifer TaxID=2619833 RepID=UPI0005B957AD|nr:beta-ketoacyl-[acyl-carrier-protein] synthase family protein [Microbulbifer sp. HZ11]
MRRVVVTGIGVVSPLGSQIQSFWGGLMDSQSGIDRLTKLDADKYPRPLAAEIKDWEQLPQSKDPSLATFGQAVGYSVAAASMAITDANLDIDPDKPNRYGVLIGTTMGNQDLVERAIDRHNLQEDQDPAIVPKADIENFSPAKLSTETAKRLSLYGGSATLVNACAAGNYSVGVGFDRIRSGRNDVILAGGADPFSRTCYTIFHRLNASTKGPCRPFDENRDGMVVGEGAAFLVLEELEHAKARNAQIYAEVTGYALTCDAYHATAPHPEGNGAVRAMKQALEMADIEKADIDYISAHGTGTRANDESEAIALHRVFGDTLNEIPVSSIKSLIGHCMGAASGFEAVACVLALKEQALPPTANTQNLDPAFPYPLDIVPNHAREAKVNHVLSNAFAFGGNVASIVMSRYE